MQLAGYDIIGDIHGHASELKTLLLNLGYSVNGTVWRHPNRKAIFVGDFIDRGSEIRETLHIVKHMTDSGSAMAVMGNHEFNAMAYNYKDPEGNFIRHHSEKNAKQHEQTIQQFKGFEEEWDEYLAWMANLPLFLEIDGIRVVHACWDDSRIDYLRKNFQGPITNEILVLAHQKGTDCYWAFEETLKGKEMTLPDGRFFIDKDGHRRTESRTKWWLNPKGKDLATYLFHAPMTLKGIPVPPEFDAAGYSLNEPPVFFGHYWLDGLNMPQLQAPNVCCLDYSVAKDGKLVACRYNLGTKTIEDFVTVDAID